MKKKITAIALAVCILAVGIVGATMSYFTDTETKTNTFTFGKVDITLSEQSIADNDNHILAGEPDGDNGYKYTKILPGLVYSKRPTVKVESDSNDAWVVITATVPTKYDHAGLLNLTGDGYTWEEKTSGSDTVYYLYYTNPLAAGTEVTPFSTVTINPALEQTNEIAGASFKVVVNAYAVQKEGLTDAKTAFNAAFADAAKPADVTATKDDVKNVLANADAGKKIALSEDVTITDTLVSKGAGVTIDGGNKTVTGNPSNNKAALTIENGATVQNLKIDESAASNTSTYEKRGVNAKSGNVTVDGCDIHYPRAVYGANANGELIIKDSTLTGVYALNADAKLKKIEVTNTKLNGWVSYSDSDDIGGTVTFTNCEFNKGDEGYAFFRPYTCTTLNGCTFSAEYLETANTKTGITSGEGVTGNTYNFIGCFVMKDGVKTPLTATLLKAMFDNTDIDNIKTNTWTVDGTTVTFPAP